MEKDEIVSTDTRLLDMFQSVFGDDVTSLKDSDGIGNIPGWDSAGHLNLIMAIEAEYGVQFDIEEMDSLTNVAALRERLSGV